MLPHLLNKRYWLLGIGLLLLWVCMATILRENLGSNVRLFNDEADRTDYFYRGSWLPLNKVPYRDVMSEYPQVPTFIFGILYIPFLKQTDPAVAYSGYSALFSFLMLCLLACLMITLDRMLPEKNKKLVFCLLLPAPLYFVYNRFDVLPSLIVVLALLLAGRQKWELAGILLGIATLTKWYPALLVLPVMTYMVWKKVPLLRIGLFVVLFGITCLVILAPTYFMGGIRALLDPYIYHGKRGFGLAAFPTLIEPMIRSLVPWATENSLKIVFVLIQGSAIPFVFFAHLDTFEKLLSWCLLIISTYILFSRIYSPQWMLWIFPLMILLVRDKIDLALVILYGTITYIEFPLVIGLFGFQSDQMAWMGWINAILLALIIIRVLRRLASLRDRGAGLTGTPVTV